MEAVNVLYMEDYRMAQDAISTILLKARDEKTQLPMFSLTVVNSEAAALEALNKKKHDIAFLGGSISQSAIFRIVERIKQRVSEIKTVMMVGRINQGNLQRALDIGLDGQISRHASGEQIIATLLKINAGGKQFDSHLMIQLLAEDVSKGLSRKDIQLLDLLSNDYTLRQIANTMKISERAVSRIKSNLKQRIGVKTDFGLVAYAIRENLI